MDRKSWPWKKKSSNKAAAAEPVIDSATSLSDPLGSQIQQVKKEENKKPKYVQISVETYSHLTGLEDQVKSYEDQVTTLEEEIKDLNEKLLESETEMTNKENLVKQHAKVAEEAVSGWEKAEAEAAALKTHLESVTLLKLTAEDRASHLDGALKECMRQIRNLKEEHEQELHDVVFTKTKQIDELKFELESRIAALDQELLRSAADNAALSRSLQDYSGMIIKLNQEKSQAEAEIQHQKSTIESNLKEINSLKYEVHIVTKEMEIRNEEKNMSVRSAEVANKQHLEGVKKIARLEAECQRLRGLVRKKLPGPAALAQMKLEVENLGRDQGDTRFRRSPVKPPTHYPTSFPELSPDIMQQYNRDNDLLSERLSAMEEETKMLKEALAKRNSELQASRSICAKTASKLQILEAQVQSNGEHSSPPKLGNQLYLDGSLGRTASRPPSMTSLSVDASDDDASCAGSWATPSVSEVSCFKKEKKTDSHDMSESSSHLGLMDDFLEMEKLAYQSNGSNAALASSGIKNDERTVIVENGASREVINEEDSLQEIHVSYPSVNQVTCERDVSEHPGMDESPAAKLQFRLTAIIDSLSRDQDITKALENLRCVLPETYNKSCHQSVSYFGESHSKIDANLAAEKDIVLSQGSEHLSETSVSMSGELSTAISRIYEFVIVLGNEAKTVQATSFDSEGLSQQMGQLSTTYEEVMNRKTSLVQFVFDLSHWMGKANELQFKVMGYRVSEAEASNSDCIDKVALPENKASFSPSGDRYPSSCAHFSDTNSDPDIPHESPARTSPPPANLWKCSLEEFEQLKSEKDSLAINLSACTEQLNNTKIQLQETEQHLAEVKSQLKSAQKINGLSETQLKCMAESYNTLETRSKELEAEVNRLLTKTEALESELQEERRSQQEALSRCKDLEDQLHRIESCPSADFDAKTNQERELSAAAEKLAECQETIFLLGKQLNSLRPQAELPVSPHSDRSRDEGFYNEPPCNSNTNWEENTDQPEADTPCTPVKKAGRQSSPTDVRDMLQSPEDSEGNDVYLSSPTSLKHPKHRPTKSVSSSSSSPTPEKHARGLSRFFSTKTKNEC